MRNTYLKELFAIAKKDRNVLSLVSDNGLIVYDDFRNELPEQYFNFGISEGHMITAAAGMASCGKIPFAYTIGSFLAYRAYEFIRLDVCLQKMNVKIIGIGAGMTYGYLGPTHHATEDLAVLRCLPNLTLLSPATPAETREMVKYAYDIEGPVYIILGNNLPDEIYTLDTKIVPGKISTIIKGTDIAIFVTGEILYQVIEAEKILKEDGIEAEIISVHTIKPLDIDNIYKVAERFTHIYSVEEHSIVGGLGSAIAEILISERFDTKLTRIGLEHCFAKGYGTREQVLEANGLSAEKIAGKIKQTYSGDERYE